MQIRPSQLALPVGIVGIVLLLVVPLPAALLDLLIALHARKSAASIEAFRRAHPAARIVLVMTGTDLYRDLPADPAALVELIRGAGPAA